MEGGKWKVHTKMFYRSIMVFNRGKLVGRSSTAAICQINGTAGPYGQHARPYRPPMYAICTGRDCLKTLKLTTRPPKWMMMYYYFRTTKQAPAQKTINNRHKWAITNLIHSFRTVSGDRRSLPITYHAVPLYYPFDNSRRIVLGELTRVDTGRLSGPAPLAGC